MGVYEDLGVTPIINASGSVTRLGGAPMPRAVLDAMTEAAASAVPIERLQGRASVEIANATGVEAGLVTAGAASALTLGAAAIMTGWDRGRMESLPQTDKFPNEFVVAREQRSGYDHAVRAAGARLVEVGFNEIVPGAGVRRTESWEYEAAFGPNTAGVLYVYTPDSAPPLVEVVARAHKHGLPVLVDAAAELPPRSNLVDIPATGADLVAFSGGKSIRGPQSTGILAGRRELVGPAFAQLVDMDDHPSLWDPPAELIDFERFDGGPPRHGVGRAHKVSKEEIVGLLTALKLFAAGAYDEEVAGYLPRLERLAAALDGAPVNCTIHDSGDGESFPILDITVDESQAGRNAFDVCRSLRNGTPPVYVGHGKLAQGTLVVNPLHLDDATADTLARRVREELGAD
ncbi:MAG: aminotransferase class V-fold PLP-dependent enzyme [Chloroflexi bacterium]|nr:aminotransferase class V-fold PLP-dependent enzyme [Chloroflexota bacterium]